MMIAWAETVATEREVNSFKKYLPKMTQQYFIINSKQLQSERELSKMSSNLLAWKTKNEWCHLLK